MTALLDFLPWPVGADAVQRSPLERALRGAPAGVRDVSLELPEDLAGIEVAGTQLLRRLTDLDLDALPATGIVAHVRATVSLNGEVFRIEFPQEYADHLAHVVLDTIAGLG